jgi:hypothetical protein
MSGFIKFLQEHRSGVTLAELGESLQSLVADVTDQGKAGTLTLTISIKPIGKNDGLEVGAEIKSKPPKGEPGKSIFFATPENNLQRQDPRQQSMELREVAPASPARALA